MQEIFIPRQATVNYVHHILKTFHFGMCFIYQQAQIDFVVFKYFKICIWTFKKANIVSVCCLLTKQFFHT